MSTQCDLALALALGATMPESAGGNSHRPEQQPPAARSTSAVTRRPCVTRNGKIARLPKAVREELNRRLEDGAQGKALVAWLNGLPEVKAVMKEAFEGRAVTEQNLSEWRQGGFLDWQRQQEARDWVRQAAEETRELEAEAGPEPLTDVLGASITLLLSRLIRELGEGLDSTPEQRHDLVLLIRQWCAIRSGDHRAAKLKMQQQDWAARRARVEAARERWEMGQPAHQQQQRNHDRAVQFVEQAALESLTRGLPEETARKLRAVFAAGRADDRGPKAPVEAGATAEVQPGPLQPDPTESDRILPKKRVKRRHGPRAAGKPLSRKAKALAPPQSPHRNQRATSPCAGRAVK